MRGPYEADQLRSSRLLPSRSVTYHAGMKRALIFLLVWAVAGAAVSAQEQAARKAPQLCPCSFENL